MKVQKNNKPKATSRQAVTEAIAKQDVETQQTLQNPQDIQEAIRIKAYELFVERGYIAGNEVEDWLTAERIILQNSR